MATERKNTQTRREEALIVTMTIIHKEGIHNLTLRRVAEGLVFLSSNIPRIVRISALSSCWSSFVAVAASFV